MSELLSRAKAKLKEWFYETPLPNLIKKLQPKDPLEDIQIRHPIFGKDVGELPDDFRDIKLEKLNKVYHLKLKNIPPHQWMQVGTSLRNLAFQDPDYGNDDPDYGRLEMDPLPPPPEQSEYIKNMKGPMVSLYLKNMDWCELEEVGEMFYDLGWVHQRKYDAGDYKNLPAEWNRCDDLEGMSELEDADEANFDPKQRIKEELTEELRITNSDVLPGIPRVPWKEDAETFLESDKPESPPWVDPKPPHILMPKSVYPMQSRVE